MTFDFQSEFNRAWGNITDRVGVEGVFTPATGDPIPLGVMFTKESQLQPSGMAQTWDTGSTIEYGLEDIPREAAVGETFTLADTIVYTVRRIESNDGFTVKVVVS